MMELVGRSNTREVPIEGNREAGTEPGPCAGISDYNAAVGGVPGIRS